MIKAARYEASNLEAARIILRDPEQYAGLPLAWACMFMDRHNREKSKIMRVLTEAALRRPNARTKSLAAAS
jgi:hypothetical protein